MHDSMVSCLSFSVSVLMSNQKYPLEFAPVMPCEKGRVGLQDRIGIARGKKEIFKPRIFTKLHEWGSAYALSGYGVMEWLRTDSGALMVEW